MKNIKGLKLQLSVLATSLAVSLSVLLSSGASAEEYNFHVGSFEECQTVTAPSTINQPRSTLNNTDPTAHKIVTDYLDLRYNSANKLLTIEAQFNDSLGNLATGFHFALSKGPRPKGFSNLAAIYFDATQASNIKVLGYAYNVVACNCANYLDRSNGVGDTYITAGSWLTAYPFVVQDGTTGEWQLSTDSLTPDPVFTSLGENANYVVEKFVETTSSGGVTYRKFRLVLNTTQLNQFVPEHLPSDAPYSWEGAQFAEKLGLRFWAVKASSTNYDASGFFANYQMGQDCSVCGYDNVSTNTSPICKSVSLSGVDANNKIKPGNKISAQIIGYDKERNDLQVNYSGQPAGSSFDIENGSLVTPDSNSEAKIDFNWTPGYNSTGSYNVEVKLTQQYGVNKANVICPFLFSVDGCEPIDWRETINEIDNKVLHDLPKRHVQVLLKRIRKARGFLTRSELTLKSRSHELGLEGWRTLAALQRNRVIRQDCGSDVPECESIDTTRATARINQIANDLVGMVQVLAPNLRKALNQNGIKGSENTKAWRPLLNSAKNVADSVIISINSLPQTVYACESF